MDYRNTELTITEIEQLTGITFKTIKKKILNLEPCRREGSKIFYHSHQALGAVFSVPQDDKLSLQHERANLAKVQAKKQELEYQILKKSVVNADEVIDEYSKRVVAAKNKFMAIPTKLGARYRAFSNPADLEEEAEQLIHEALKEMAVPHASN